MFWRGLASLRETDKLGMLACQFLPYFVAHPTNFDYIEPSRTVSHRLNRNRIPSSKLGSRPATTG
jgi:hypothetical protein